MAKNILGQCIWGLLMATIPLWGLLLFSVVIAYYCIRGAITGFLNGIVIASFAGVDIIDHFRP